MILLIPIVIYLFTLCCYEIQIRENKITKFDPFEILQLEPSADKKMIKQAYRNLTLIYHPDKNPDTKQKKSLSKFQKPITPYQMRLPTTILKFTIMQMEIVLLSLP
jgi:preprotein translocase subunit Sec63